MAIFPKIFPAWGVILAEKFENDNPVQLRTFLGSLSVIKYPNMMTLTLILSDSFLPTDAFLKTWILKFTKLLWFVFTGRQWQFHWASGTFGTFNALFTSVTPSVKWKWWPTASCQLWNCFPQSLWYVSISFVDSQTNIAKLIPCFTKNLWIILFQ